MIQVFMCVLVLGPSLYSVAEGCGRVPATPAPTTTTPAPTEPTINGSYRAIDCNSEEKNRTACLNGGTCFVLVIQGERSANCHCPPRYTGKRCQHINFEGLFPTQDPGNVAKAGIAASIAVLVIIIIVFTAVAIVYHRRKRRLQREKQSEGQPMANGLPENSAQANPKINRNGDISVNHINGSGQEEKEKFLSYQVTTV